MMRVFLLIGSAAKTPYPCSFERLRTIFGSGLGVDIAIMINARDELAGRQPLSDCTP
jgi:hypothetical protein